MKKLGLILFLFLVGHAAFSQYSVRSFGNVSIKELEMTIYEEDPDAEALVLYDIGEASYIEPEYGYRLQFTRTKRIKILKKSGMDYATVYIPVYRESSLKSEEILSIEAFTYNYSNDEVHKIPLNPSEIYKEKINEHVTVHKFTFPELKKGSVVEVRYVTKSPYNGDLPDWAFQSEIPTLYSQYTVNMIPFYEFAYMAQGIDKFDYAGSHEGGEFRYFNTGVRNVEFKDVVNSFVMKNIPAFKSEDYITSRNDYLMKVKFQLSQVKQANGKYKRFMTTWPKLVEDLWNETSFGKYLRKSRKYAKRIIEDNLELQGKNEIEKSRLIIEYMKTAYSWNGEYSKYASKTPKEFYEHRNGNSADINLFLTALLVSAGVQADPVILSTRGHGKIHSKYPFASHFNYVAVLVNAQPLFLTDATRSALAYNRIPPYCINEKGLVINEKNIGWIDLNSPLISTNTTVLGMEIDVENLTAKTQAMVQTTEYETYQYKAGFEGDSEKLREYFKKKGFDKIRDLSTYNYESSNKPYVMRFAGEYEVEKLGGKLVVTPFMKFPMQENKLTQRTRTYPVDMIYAYNDNFKSAVTIPLGYQVTALPEDYAIDNELVTIELRYTKNQEAVDVSASYTFKKPVYQPEEYARIKEYMQLIVDKFNQPLVFEKADDAQAKQ